jgi:hypothetical protein
MRQDCLHAEAGMRHGAAHRLELRLAGCIVFHNAVFSPRLHAVAGSQHQLWADQGATAERSAGTNDGDDRAPDAVRRWRRATDDGKRGACGRQRSDSSGREHDVLHRRSNSRCKRYRQASRTVLAIDQQDE